MEKTKKKAKKKDPLSRTPYTRRSDQEMAKIASEVESGLLGIRTACLKYGLCRNTLKLYLLKRTMLNLDSPNVRQKQLPTMMQQPTESALKKEVQRLNKELEYAKMKLLSLETMIQEAEKHLQIKIKKSMVPNSQKVKATASQPKLGEAMLESCDNNVSLFFLFQDHRKKIIVFKSYKAI